MNDYAESERIARLEDDPERWLRTFFPSVTSFVSREGAREDGAQAPLAPHHRELLEWIRALRPGERPVPPAFFAIWPRGGGKSTLAHAAAVYASATGRRQYGLYVCASQERADSHVRDIQFLLESPEFRSVYPDAGARREMRYGDTAGWRRDRLVANNGFIMDGLGLDGAIRGRTLMTHRPDFILVDDIDGENDSEVRVSNNLRTLSSAVMGAGDRSLAVVMLQNLVRRGGAIEQIVNSDAVAMLRWRHQSGPVPALEGFDPDRHVEYGPDGEPRIVGGEPTWAALGREELAHFFDVMGRDSFMREMQHEMGDQADLVYSGFDPNLHLWRPERDGELQIVGHAGGLDFAGEGHAAADAAGLVAGIDARRRIVLMAEWKERGSNILQRQAEWMHYCSESIGRNITWYADSTDPGAITHLNSLGFSVIPSLKGRVGGDRKVSRESRVRLVGARLAPRGPAGPGLLYGPRLRAWRQEILNYRRKPAPIPGAVREIDRRNDHLMTAMEYLVEGLDWRQGWQFGAERPVRVPVRL